MDMEHRATDEVDADEASRLQQYEIVWILPRQHTHSGNTEGFGLEILDFLGPGDPDFRGQPTVWVRGPVIETACVQGRISFIRGRLVTVAIPHDQPRARRTGGAVLPPPSGLLLE